MGRYFYPLYNLTNCRKLNGCKYNELVKQLYLNEILVGLFDRVEFNIAPFIESEDEFNNFWNQIIDGDIVSYEFYATKK